MFDNEQAIPLKQVRFLPCFRLPLSRKTPWNWCSRGIKGIKLECRRVAGRIETSVEAVERFLALVEDQR